MADTPPCLEDVTYAGRGGGYIIRITSKLMQESAAAGRRQLFLPIEPTCDPCYVYEGSDASSRPVYEVPSMFYGPLIARLKLLFKLDGNTLSGEFTHVFDGVSYAFRLESVSKPRGGLLLSIS